MRHFLTRMMAVPVVCFLAGCQQEAGTSTKPPAQVKDAGKKADADDHDHDHDHAAAGPHGGRLVEFGDEEYHGEWVHDEASGKVTIYILDGKAAKDFLIEANAIVVEAKLDDKEEQFKLEPVNPSADATPKTAQFEIVSKKLGSMLASVGHGVEATLTADIEGKVFVGKFEDIHDHHDH